MTKVSEKGTILKSMFLLQEEQIFSLKVDPIESGGKYENGRVSFPLSLPIHFNTYVIRKIISIFHGCMVWIEKSVTRVTDRHQEACRVMPNSDPE